MISRFTAEDSALLLIDHQASTMQLVRNLPLEVVARNTLTLAKMARILGLPVVLTSSQERDIQGPLIPELDVLLPRAFSRRVQRNGIVNAWDDANFKLAVEATERRQLIMAGVTTDMSLVYPAVSAVQAGYQVQAVMDASGSPFDISEDMARRRMENAGVTLTTTNTIMAELARDWSRPEGIELFDLLCCDVLPRMGSTFPSSRPVA